LELGGAISLLSFITYKPYGVSNFFKNWSEFSKKKKKSFCFLIGWFVRLGVHFRWDIAYGSNQT
jgi:GTP-dependent phosphoenolpyruvate carboxykinase